MMSEALERVRNLGKVRVETPSGPTNSKLPWLIQFSVTGATCSLPAIEEAPEKPSG